MKLIRTIIFTLVLITTPIIDGLINSFFEYSCKISISKVLFSPDSAYAWQLGELPVVTTEQYIVPDLSESELAERREAAVQAFLKGREYEFQKDHANARPHYRKAFDIFTKIGVRDHEYATICTRLGMVEMRLWEKGKIPIEELIDDYINLKRYGDLLKKFQFDFDAPKGSTDYNARRNAAIVYNLLGNLGEVLRCGKSRTTAVNANICADYREANRLFPEGGFYKNVNRCASRGL